MERVLHIVYHEKTGKDKTVLNVVEYPDSEGKISIINLFVGDRAENIYKLLVGARGR